MKPMSIELSGGSRRGAVRRKGELGRPWCAAAARASATKPATGISSARAVAVRRRSDRQQLGLEPKRKDWRPDAMDRLPKRATEHFEKGRALMKEAKGLK
jgi:hypothetical protein